MDKQNPSRRLTVLAHEPDAGWITFAVVTSPETADRARLDALVDGFDEAVIA